MSLSGSCRPIHDAIEIGNVDMVRLLVERGADLLVEYGERTAVEFARDQNQLEIADYIKGWSIIPVVVFMKSCSLGSDVQWNLRTRDSLGLNSFVPCREVVPISEVK